MKKIILILCINIFIGALGYHYGYHIGWNTELEPWGLSMLTQEQSENIWDKKIERQWIQELHRTIFLNQLDQRMVLFSQNYSKKHIEQMTGKISAFYQGKKLPVYQSVYLFSKVDNTMEEKSDFEKQRPDEVYIKEYRVHPLNPDEEEMKEFFGITTPVLVDSQIELTFHQEMSFEIEIKKQQEQLIKSDLWQAGTSHPYGGEIKATTVFTESGKSTQNSLPYKEIVDLPDEPGRYRVWIRTVDLSLGADNLICDYYFFVQLKEGEIS